MRRFHIAITICALAVGCALGGPRDRGPVSFDAPAQPQGATPFPNWPVPPERAERLLGDTPLDDENIEMVSLGSAGGGVTGAHRDEIRFLKAGEQLMLGESGSLEGCVRDGLGVSDATVERLRAVRFPGGPARRRAAAEGVQRRCSQLRPRLHGELIEV